MKSRNISGGLSIGAILVLTVSFCYSGLKSELQVYVAGGRSMLHEAAQKGDLAEVKRLLEQGAVVNAKDHNGETPLAQAVDKGHGELAELLIAKGADVNSKDENSRTPLHYAENKDLAEFLIAKGADVKARDNDGITPLHKRVLGNKETTELLIAKGADVNAKDYKGWTPLRRAGDNKQMTELLIANGADPLPPPSAGPEAFADRIPENLREAAEAVFNKGYLYFIWSPKEGPFVFNEKKTDVIEIPLSYHVPAEFGVPRRVNLTHAARPDQGEDLVWTEPRAGNQPYRLLASRTFPRTSENQFSTTSR